MLVTAVPASLRGRIMSNHQLHLGAALGVPRTAPPKAFQGSERLFLADQVWKHMEALKASKSVVRHGQLMISCSPTAMPIKRFAPVVNRVSKLHICAGVLYFFGCSICNT